jgi:hypothetical protein
MRLINGSSTVDKVTAGKIRARDVREMLTGSGIDPKVQHIMEGLAEASFENTKQLAAMAGALSQMADIISNFTLVAERMKKKIIDLEGGMTDAAPEIGPVTQ